MDNYFNIFLEDCCVQNANERVSQKDLICAFAHYLEHTCKAGSKFEMLLVAEKHLFALCVSHGLKVQYKPNEVIGVYIVRTKPTKEFTSEGGWLAHVYGKSTELLTKAQEQGNRPPRMLEERIPQGGFLPNAPLITLVIK